MIVLAEYRVVNATGVELFYEERKESELPKPGDAIVLTDNGATRKLNCVEQIGSYVYNSKKQIYQYTFNCERLV
jgi:hypothetical protein